MKLRSWAFAATFLTAVWFTQGVAAQGARLPDFTDLYEQQAPAVVSVDVTQKARRSQFPDLSEDDPFYEFFRRFGPIPRGTPRPREFEQQASGSGFILTGDGYVLTNAHVVEDASEVTVRLSDKREFKAKVIGADKRTDVALLKIDVTGLPKVTIGDSEKLRVGEWVAAIGKPFGLENTITAGIVSAKGRDLPQEGGNLVSFIQTDVPINPGNSGGPLFNMKGEVVGINSIIFTRTGGYMGLAFAIPIEMAMNVVKQLQEKGRVTRGRIGVQIQEVSKETADAFGLSKQGGALVNSVEKGGPADKAGVESGDIILKVEGKTVNSSAELPRIITQVKPGTKITLQVWRKGATKDIPVTVVELKEEEATRPVRRTAPGKEKAKPNRIGLVLSDLSDEQKKELDIKNGVVVEDITGNARGDIQPGDIILAIISRGASIDAKNAEQVNQLIAKLEKGTSVTLLLRRGEQQFFSTIRLSNGN
ncbi:MAG TPA: DegQ family serine endoprotease [Casimicrobiaceae bacterium]|nr:DegQ family serine endoprotease [Casimicrobiaceae bacterium]